MSVNEDHRNGLKKCNHHKANCPCEWVKQTQPVLASSGAKNKAHEEADSAHDSCNESWKIFMFFRSEKCAEYEGDMQTRHERDNRLKLQTFQRKTSMVGDLMFYLIFLA